MARSSSRASGLLPMKLSSTKKTLRTPRSRSTSSSRQICAGVDVVAAAAIVVEEIALPRELHAHAADADQVGTGIDRHGLDVFIDDLHVPRRRRQRGQRGQAEGRIDRALARKNLVDCPTKT